MKISIVRNRILPFIIGGILAFLSNFTLALDYAYSFWHSTPLLIILPFIAGLFFKTKQSLLFAFIAYAIYYVTTIILVEFAPIILINELISFASLTLGFTVALTSKKYLRLFLVLLMLLLAFLNIRFKEDYHWNTKHQTVQSDDYSKKAQDFVLTDSLGVSENINTNQKITIVALYKDMGCKYCHVLFEFLNSFKIKYPSEHYQIICADLHAKSFETFKKFQDEYRTLYDLDFRMDENNDLLIFNAPPGGYPVLVIFDVNGIPTDIINGHHPNGERKLELLLKSKIQTL